MSISTRCCQAGHLLEEEAKYCPECGSPVATQPGASTETQLEDDHEVSANPDIALPHLEQDSTGERPSIHRSRKRLGVLLGAVTLLLLAAAAAWYFGLRVAAEERFLEELASTGRLDEYGTRESAVAQGKAFCVDLSSGATVAGYERQRIAVASFCPEFLSEFEVVPTPEEQRSELTEGLRESGLGGRFSSDAAAVAHAESVCRGLAEGGEQQGPEEDAVAVRVYCDEYSSGFKTLYPIKVKGSLELLDFDPSLYYPSITGAGKSCEGDNGYSDIGPGTQVVVKSNSGEVLTTTSLGRGTGLPPIQCEFKFRFTVMDGVDGGYMVSISDRGEFHYTATELRMPETVALTLGE